MSATTEWTDQYPTKCGAYLVRSVGDWFPEGNPNNIAYFTVDAVMANGAVRVLHNGSFSTKADCRGWKFAKILP